MIINIVKIYNLKFSDEKMTRVEGTNDYSIVSKLSATVADFFHDDFLSEMVDKPRSRAPLINWGYYIRYKSLEMTFEKAVQYLSSKGSPFQEGKFIIIVSQGHIHIYENGNLNDII